MSDPQPIHVGEILRGIRAADHNAFYETWRKVNQLPPPKANKEANQFSNRLVVSVFNDTGSDITADFPILKLTGPCFTVDDREGVVYEPIAFNGQTPDEHTEPAHIAIIQGAIGADRKGHGVISGSAWVKVEWTAEGHTHAAVSAGENTKLKSAAAGIEIQWHQEVPDEEYLPVDLWAVVSLGGSSSGALIKYSQVTAILPDPEESVDDFSVPYQPVQVKMLDFVGYEPATSGTVSTDNTDIVITTTQNGEKHGIRGDGIEVTFVVDAGITDDCEATYDDETDVLEIKVKTTAVLWSTVEAAVAIAVPMAGAFTLVADDPGAAVGASIGSVTATLANGDDGHYLVNGDEFGIGDHDTKDDVAVDDKVWIIWREDAQRWEIFAGTGGSGDGKWGIITSDASGSTTADLPSSDGVVELFDSFGGETIGVYNYTPDAAPAGRVARVTVTGETAILDWWSCRSFPS